jgi:hypothetical protein
MKLADLLVPATTTRVERAIDDEINGALKTKPSNGWRPQPKVGKTPSIPD